ncbi:low molecular weight protein arginine phosphatase [bacterium]|nr:low molecular weight protein arginine phosphatase [bacterium]
MCTGNICRSPFAEAVLKSLVADDAGCGITVESAGIGGFEGNSPTDLALIAAAEQGLRMEDHLSRPLTKERLGRADLILTMEKAQRNWIVRTWPESGAKTHMLKNYGKSGPEEDIEDPIGMDLDYYRACFQEIVREVRRVFPLIRSAARAGDRG